MTPKVSPPFVCAFIRYLSSGPVEKGGFYTFGGGWSAQENQGVVWLTNHKTVQRNVCRPKTARLQKDAILLVYEIWTGTTYVQTEYMVVDDSGRGVQAKTVLDGAHHLRVAPTDDLVVVDGLAVWCGRLLPP